MPKKVILFLIGAIFFSGCNLARADVVINEIMYDPQDADVQREWVEIYNSTTSDLDLSTWKFLEKSDASNHGLNIVQGNPVVSPGGYALIVIDLAKFLPSWFFDGTIFKVNRVTSLNNSGSTLILKNSSGTEVSRYEYNSSQGANDNGKSLQRQNDGSWVVATPTPGATNESVTPPPSDGGSTGSGGSSGGGGASTTTTETTSKAPEIKKIKTQIMTNTLAFARVPFYFQGISYGHNGEQLYSGKYFWNFGDGDSREIKSNDMGKFTHTYFYPGEYVVSLEYFMNKYSDIPDAVEKTTIKVVGADILISSVGDEKDFFVELANNTNYDADISKWILAGNNQSFVFPKNTVLGSKKKIMFSSKITHFSISDKNNLKLLNMQGELIFDYLSSILVPVAPIKNAVQSKLSSSQDQINSTAAKLPLGGLTAKLMPVSDEQILTSNLSASALESDAIKNNNSYLPMLASIIFIGISAGAVYFIRQKKTVLNVGDDFNILDE